MTISQPVRRLRDESLNRVPAISMWRAQLVDAVCRRHEGQVPVPVLRALVFRELMEKKTLWIGEGELIVGERGEAPAATPTYPELCCHTLDDFRVMNERERIFFRVGEEARRIQAERIIPYWEERSMRARILKEMTPEWRECYAAGIFTEFMEQRGPGHTVADGKIYRKGFAQFKAEIARSLETLDASGDPPAFERKAQLQAMAICCDAIVAFARRHAELAEDLADACDDPERQEELYEIAAVCRWVPERAPRTFHEALQMYWFVHLGVITEMNNWDAFNPGRLDQHLDPFYRREIAAGTLTPERAKELLQCFWIKFNNHPAPPKVGVTAQESGTYNDFTNINLGGLTREGEDAVSDLSYLILEVVDEVHLLQPQSNVQISARTPDRFLQAASRLIRKGYGYPSVFNTDMVVAEQVRAGKAQEDAREGGNRGCIETGAFGKEAYLLTGYFNTPKLLELALHDGVDPATGKRIGPATGDPRAFASFEDLYHAFATQLKHFVDVKVEVNAYIEQLFASDYPAPFLSVVIQDCIAKGRDYYDGGPRYNTTYIQCCGLGTATDSLSALKTHVFDCHTVPMGDLVTALDGDFKDKEPSRQWLQNKTPRFGNDDDRADDLSRRIYQSLFDAIEGRPNGRGGRYHLNMLSTTCHVYFGTKVGATADGRHAGLPISDGTSPAQGADRHGPTAVCRSLGKLDQSKSGGTLLNQRFLPGVLEGDTGIDALAALIRGYFQLGGHHIQFNVVGSDTLRDAQRHPDQYRDLLVRVAGYSDYFVDIGKDLQDEIISRTAHEEY